MTINDNEKELLEAFFESVDCGMLDDCDEMIFLSDLRDVVAEFLEIIEDKINDFIEEKL